MGRSFSCRTGYRLFLTLIALVSLLGCGGDGASEASLSGTITFNDRPVARGSLNLMPLGGGPNVGSTIVDGGYSVEELMPGKYKVDIFGIESGKVVTSQAELQRMAEAGEKPAEPKEIPQDAKGNGVEIQIEPGANSHDFKLTL